MKYELSKGDVVLVGKFKNIKATIQDFSHDKHGPTILTDKGEYPVFHFRLQKSESMTKAQVLLGMIDS